MAQTPTQTGRTQSSVTCHPMQTNLMSPIPRIHMSCSLYSRVCKYILFACHILVNLLQLCEVDLHEQSPLHLIRIDVFNYSQPSDFGGGCCGVGGGGGSGGKCGVMIIYRPLDIQVALECSIHCATTKNKEVEDFNKC